MNQAPLRSVVTGYAVCFAGFIVYASATTIADALHGNGHHGTMITLALAGTEIVAAIAFMFRQARRVAATVLLVVFAIAALLTAARGQIPASLIFYALTTSVIVLLDRQKPLQQAAA